MATLLRFFRVGLTARFRPRIGLFDETSLHLRVWLQDVDIQWHMNNGRYLSLMDLGRLDMVMRTGLVRRVAREGWHPVVAAETIRFKESLLPFARFELLTRLMGWDSKSFYMRHVFMHRGRLVATALVRIRFLTKSGGTVDATTVATLIAPGRDSPPLPDYVHTWQRAEQELSQGTRRARHD